MQKNDKKKYRSLNKEEREKIIKEILQEKRTFQEVSEQFQVPISRCKYIVRTFFLEGRTTKKERRVRKMKKIVTECNVVIDPLFPLNSTINFDSKIENVIETSRRSKAVNTETESQSNELFLKLKSFFSSLSTVKIEEE